MSELDQDHLEKLQNNSWRTVRNTLIVLGLTFTAIGTYLIFELGSPKRGPDGGVLSDEFDDKPIVLQYLYRTARELTQYKKVSVLNFFPLLSSFFRLISSLKMLICYVMVFFSCFFLFDQNIIDNYLSISYTMR